MNVVSPFVSIAAVPRSCRSNSFLVANRTDHDPLQILDSIGLAEHIKGPQFSRPAVAERVKLIRLQPRNHNARLRPNTFCGRQQVLVCAINEPIFAENQEYVLLREGLARLLD